MKKIMFQFALLIFVFNFLQGKGLKKPDVVLQKTASVMETRGPRGEKPVSYKSIRLSDSQKEMIKGKNLKGAVLMHNTSDFSNALIAGIKDTAKQLNIKIVAVTDAGMDANKQRTDLETVMALKPDFIISLVLDPVSGAETFKKAVEKGIKLAFISNLPQGFVHGKDYAAVVTDDLFGMGKSMAEMIGDSLGGKGKIALLFHDANYYVTNQRDQAVKTVLQKKYPGIKIVAERGIANPNDGEAIASAILTQFPDVQAIYAPWDTIAEGVVAAARASGRSDLKVFTMDLGGNNALDMARNGVMKGIVVDLPYEIGETLTKAAGLSTIGADTPPFIIVPAIKVRKDNLKEQWEKSLKRSLPKEVAEALR